MIGLGCMRMSTEVGRDDARSASVLSAALDAGITVFDTADAYARDDADFGHNEQLLARALAGRRVEIITKGGLTRPDGAWVPNGRARHLDAAARASRDRLGVAALDVYLLHAPDPRTPLATSVRALAKLREAGVARTIGLSNIGLHQLEQALAITSIDSVEVELNPWKLDAIRGGLVAACAGRGIRVLAHRPLGGPAGVKRLARNAVVTALAAQAQLAPAELVLAWLRHLAPVIVPLPGATRIETVHSAARAQSAVLADEVVAALDAHFLAVGSAPRAARDHTDGREVVLVMGMPAAGKSTLAADYEARGHVRLNRDDRGGTLLELARALDRELSAGTTHVVLDNTYGTRALRAPVLEIAARHGVPVRCVELATTIEQAQANAAARILVQHGRLLEPTELAKAGAIAPSAQFRYRRAYEEPRADEGFAAIERVPFAPRQCGSRPALVVELDGLVWKRPALPTIVLAPGARERLAAWHAAGYLLAGTTWLTPPAADAALLAALDLPLHVVRCPHPAGPPICWCRKPLPGLALALAHAHDLDLARSVHVGRGPADRGFALRAGLRYVDIVDGWPAP